MQCHNCGGEIPKGRGVQTTASERVGPPGRFGQSTRVIHIMLCPACARSRRVMFWCLLVFVALLVIGAILAGQT